MLDKGVQIVPILIGLVADGLKSSSVKQVVFMWKGMGYARVTTFRNLKQR